MEEPWRPRAVSCAICTYTGYERGILAALADALPHRRSDLDRVCARLWDLHPVVRAHYYHPDFEGSYSIKAVLTSWFDQQPEHGFLKWLVSCYTDRESAQRPCNQMEEGRPE
jgi:hypothetical protein